nr:MAG TPA: DNA polymerase II large subunit [Caudoviricetes sp.]
MNNITPRERREVAKSLRYIADLPGEPLENDGQFVEVLKYWVFLDFKRCSYDETLTRLADLIDPTCEFVEVPDNDEFMVRVVSGFMCKKCGHESIVERNCDGWAEPPNYCPNCGARVVRDEA